MAPSAQQIAPAADSAVAKVDSAQILKAAKALTKQLEKTRKESRGKSAKKDLLAGDEDEEPEVEGEEGEPIYLTINTKRHILDRNRLKPSTIKIPHSLHNTGPTSTLRICLITADPPTETPKAYKDLIRQDQSFPPTLSSKIQKVIAVSKLRSKYKAYESLRQLHAEHDLFLADDRILHLLPQILGNKFYKTTAKRPIPVVLSRPLSAKEGKSKDKSKPIGGKQKAKVAEAGGPTSIGSATQVGASIEAALSSAYVHLSQSASTNVKVALSSFPAEWTAENAGVVAAELVERSVPQKWRNVASIYLKGARTVGLPLYLADELWLDEGDVKDQGDGEQGLLEGGAVEVSEAPKKRKVAEGADGEKEAAKKKAKREKADENKKSSASRKDHLKKLKAQAVAQASA